MTTIGGKTRFLVLVFLENNQDSAIYLLVFYVIDSKMHREVVRLETFKYFPSSSPVKAEDLARNGFFFTGYPSNDSCECFSCGAVIGCWQTNDLVAYEHLRLSSDCDLVRDRFTTNEPRDVFLFLNSLRQMHRYAYLRESFDIEENQESVQNNQATVVSREGGRMDRVRNLLRGLEIRSDQPDNQVSHSPLLGGGPVRQNSPARQNSPVRRNSPATQNSTVRYARRDSPTIQNSPVRYARRDSPDRQNSPVRRDSSARQNSSVPRSYDIIDDFPRGQAQIKGITTESDDYFKSILQKVTLDTLQKTINGTRNSKSPVHPDYKAINKRLSSFKNMWPLQLSQKPEGMCEAGLFYTAIMDFVVCFHCNVRLGEWKYGDDPFIRHIQANSNCKYLSVVKGKKFIANVMSIVSSSTPITSVHSSTTSLTTSLPTASNVQELTPLSKPCIICLDKEISTVVVPCGHMYGCGSCAKSFKNCPICRKEISEIFRTYEA